MEKNSEYSEPELSSGTFLRLPSNGEIMRAFAVLFLLVVSFPAFCVVPLQPSGQGLAHPYLQIVCHKYSPDDPEIPRAILKSLNQPASQMFKDARGTIWQATQHGLIEVDSTDHKEKILTGKDGLPILSVTGITGGRDGKLWLATSQGAVLFIPDNAPDKRSFYFWGQRYLLDNQVLQIVAQGNKAWIRTRTGISLIEFEPYTLEQKSQVFLKRIQERHNRYGYVAGCQLLRAGDPASFRMIPDDNDGLWTSMYVAAESFRYAATHSDAALQNARTSLAALLRLVSITGISGLPARSLMHKGDYREPDGEWHWTPDGQWEWKGDTSSDELVGHFFAYWVAYNLLPGEGDRAAIRSAVSNIANGLLNHQLQLIGYGGHVTTWGRYDPAYLRSVDSGERALDSLELLSHLHVAYEITGDAKFLDAYYRIGKESGYFENIQYFEDDPSEEINYSDEELAFLSFYPLVNSENDPRLHRQYQVALAKVWQHVRDEKNPLWNLIYAEGTKAKDYKCAEAADALNRIPLDTTSWTVNNSQRSDLLTAERSGRYGEAQSRKAIPPNERSVMKWNGNPFRLDDGDNGRSEDDGTFFLLPYWLGRYYHLLPCSP
jgi:hypothetical protein